MIPYLFSQERINQFQKPTAHPDARKCYIARTEGEQLIDFLARIVIPKFKSYELQTVRFSEIEADPKIRTEEESVVGAIASKISRSETIDPPMFDITSKEFYNGRKTFEAYKRSGATSIEIIICNSGDR